MTFEGILDQTIAMLQRRGRLTYGKSSGVVTFLALAIRVALNLGKR